MSYYEFLRTYRKVIHLAYHHKNYLVRKKNRKRLVKLWNKHCVYPSYRSDAPNIRVGGHWFNSYLNDPKHYILRLDYKDYFFGKYPYEIIPGAKPCFVI